MADEGKKTDVKDEPDKKDDGKKDSFENREMRKAFEARDKAKVRAAEAEAEAKAAKAKVKAIEDAKKIAEGKTAEVLTATQAEVAETNARLEKVAADQQSLSDDRDRYKNGLDATVKARIAQIPEEMQSLVPEGLDPIDLSAWLDRNDGLLVKKPSAAKPAPQGTVPGQSVPTGYDEFLKMRGSARMALKKADPNRFAEFARREAEEQNNGRRQAFSNVQG